jgi:hypothetical protein
LPDSGYYNRSVPITKSDTVNYDGTTVSTTGTYQTTGNTKPIPADAIFVGGAGIVVGVLENGQTDQWTCVAGEILPFRTIRVNSTTTTATLMTALYVV